MWMSRALWSSCWLFSEAEETRHCWVCVDLTWLWEQIRVTSESLTSHAGKHTLIYSNVCKCVYVCIMHVCLCAQGGQSHGCHEEPLWAHSWPGRSEISQMQRQRKSVEHPYYTGTKKDSLLFWNTSLMHGNVHNAKASFLFDQDKILKLNCRNRAGGKWSWKTQLWLANYDLDPLFFTNIYWKKKNNNKIIRHYKI